MNQEIDEKENIKKIIFKNLKTISNLNSKERHSYFQLQNFLIGKEPTVQSKMWRCVTELKARKKNLKSIRLQIADFKDEIKLTIIKQKNINSENKEIEKILENKYKRSITNTKDKIKELKESENCILEECNFLINIFHILNNKEELKPYDDLKSQEEYWERKLSQDFNLRNVFNLPPDLETLKTILSLNPSSDLKKELINYLSKIGTNTIEKEKNDKLI